MSGFVYIWRDSKNNRYYVGSHWGSKNDKYICSSNSMREAYRRRPHDFKRRIIAHILTTREDLLTEEQRWLDMIQRNEFGIRYYNINSKVRALSWWVNEETRKQVGAKLSISNKGSQNRLGKKHTDETKAKLRAHFKGKKQTPEHIENSRIGQIGSKHKKHVFKSDFVCHSKGKKCPNISEALKAYHQRRRDISNTVEVN